MSDIGDAGGEILGMFIGPVIGVICVIALPFMLIDKGCKWYESKYHKQPIENTYTPPVKKESLSFRAGQKTKESVKDFARGIFTKQK